MCWNKCYRILTRFHFLNVFILEMNYILIYCNSFQTIYTLKSSILISFLYFTPLFFSTRIQYHDEQKEEFNLKKRSRLAHVFNLIHSIFWQNPLQLIDANVLEFMKTDSPYTYKTFQHNDGFFVKRKIWKIIMSNFQYNKIHFPK
jgi:site-specific DNA-adenine methylase